MPSDFESSLVILGWHFGGQITSAGVIRADHSFSGFLLNEAFAKFAIDGEHLSGFPFFCVFGQDDLQLRPSHNNYSKENSDYLYRLACRGSADDFRALGVSNRQLQRVYIDKELTLMHGASLYGNMDVLYYLKDVGAHKVRTRGMSPIIRYAVLGARAKAVEFLKGLGHSAIKNGKLNYNPFEEAIRLGHIGVVDILTNDNKYIKYKGKNGNAAYQSIVSGREDIFKLIRKKSDSSEPEIKPGEFGLTASALQRYFHDNCLLGHTEIVRALHGLGAEIDEPTKGVKPLEAVVRSGNIKLVKYLLKQGVDKEIEIGSLKQKLLHLASQKGFQDIIRLLVEEGLDINAQDTRGMTPLYLAVLSKQVNSVHELLGLGADPNIKPERRPAAVWMAVVQDERESIQSLIDYGATCELDDTLAMQLMDYALAFDIPEVVTISLEQCLTSDFSFRGSVPGIWVADYYDAELSKKVLLTAGANLNSKPNWEFKKPHNTINRLFDAENLSVQYPKRLREKYGDLKVRIEVIIDPVGKVRFPKFLEPLPWDLQLFLRESIRNWSIDLPQNDDLNTAYRVVIPLELKTDDYGVKVYEIADLEKAPVPKVRVAPIYPVHLKNNRVQGSVSVVFIVDETGRVVRPRIETSSNHEFNQAALEAVRQWRFTPGYVNGRPVMTRIRLPLSFTLRK